MKKLRITPPAPIPGWNSLERIGGAAALLAGVVLRRNLGVEIAIFSPISPPTDPTAWLLLLQTHRLLGLAYLGIFDFVNAILIGWMLLGLYIALRPSHRGRALLALVLGCLGITVLLSSNTALAMLSLSDQFAAVTNDASRALLTQAAQALLARGRFGSSGAHPGLGGYVSLLLIAAAGWIFSITLRRSPRFGRWAAITGILANSLDLMYCLAFPFFGNAARQQLAVMFIPAAGLFFMVWHILVGARLLQDARMSPTSVAEVQPV